MRCNVDLLYPLEYTLSQVISFEEYAVDYVVKINIKGVFGLKSGLKVRVLYK
jgi:hypothetical protein